MISSYLDMLRFDSRRFASSSVSSKRFYRGFLVLFACIWNSSIATFTALGTGMRAAERRDAKAPQPVKSKTRTCHRRVGAGLRLTVRLGGTGRDGKPTVPFVEKISFLFAPRGIVNKCFFGNKNLLV